MLVISRKRDQKICVGDNIVITVANIGPGSVRIGVEAPKEIPIHREEIYVEIHKENRLKEVRENPLPAKGEPGAE
jgi:carbon storage regulator